MANSMLFRRGYLLYNQNSSSLFKAISTFQSRFSSDKKGEGSKDKAATIRSKAINKTNDVSPDPVLNNKEVKGESSVLAEDISLNQSNPYEKHSSPEEALTKFAKLIEKVKASQNEISGVKTTHENSDIEASEDSKMEESTESFATMFRKSKFVALGEHKGRLVEGTIIETMGTDLYIDFGGKFHCVCPRPNTPNSEINYRRGAQVLLQLQCMEMSSAFLGSDIHVTLLEADATLLGLKRKNRANPT
ncbi:small ribosomal subunit protein bS1m-like [Physella acuta]|uniref:small ribosomal subunit protein bS1m-like n=1 Tax=Physella acuta TaxID=109671 RepID=UPI0027DCCE1D|nr:small ribosomal subunit protein bS1m-like [Physella acuta]